jgi:hypothetical protein
MSSPFFYKRHGYMGPGVVKKVLSIVYEITQHLDILLGAGPSYPLCWQMWLKSVSQLDHGCCY